VCQVKTYTERAAVATRKRVLMARDERITSLSITFDQPVQRFGLVRIGTRGGASTPPWTMTGYDRNGTMIGRVGEEHGLPPEPKEFSVGGGAIARVELRSDNRYGQGTWATWNSLPVTHFILQR
jgi:hypothetical protein